MSNTYFSLPREIFEKFDINHDVNIVEDGICIPIRVQLKRDATKLVVFLPGAFDRSVSNQVKFQRGTYFKDIEANCICIFDPTLFLDQDISIGWFQGNTESDSLTEKMYKLLTQITNILKIESENILFFGTSAGGIPSIQLASLFSNSIVYVGNIQTNFLKYYKGNISRKKVIEKVYSCVGDEEINKLYNDKVCIEHIDAKFKLIYAQNMADEFHYINHFKPYFECLKRKHSISAEVYLYNDVERGHSPIGKDKELDIIKSILNSRSISNLINDLDFNPILVI